MALHKSTNGGSSWDSYKVNNNPGLAYCVAVNPDNDKVIYLGGYHKKGGTNTGGLFKSTNGGNKFKEIGKKYFSKKYNYVYCIAVDPFSPDTVYVATDYSLFKSSNAGSSWQELTNNIANYVYISNIFLDPVVKDRIYIATRDGIYFSNDGGTEWAHIVKGMINSDTHCMEVSPSMDYLYAGTDGAGVYRCSNKNLKTVEY
jgi:photosystem II stability/assembly factor-like uncharacterized protein